MLFTFNIIIIVLTRLFLFKHSKLNGFTQIIIKNEDKKTRIGSC